MIGAAQHHQSAALRKRHGKIGAPGDAMGMDDDRGNIVERNAADFFPIFADHEKTSIGRKMLPVGRDIDDAFH